MKFSGWVLVGVCSDCSLVTIRCMKSASRCGGPMTWIQPSSRPKLRRSITADRPNFPPIDLTKSPYGDRLAHVSHEHLVVDERHFWPVGIPVLVVVLALAPG